MRLLAVLLIMIVTVGCGPKPGVETVVEIYPVDLKVEVNDQSMILSWRKSADGTISGYNIYISETPLVARFPGKNIDPDIETYNVTPFPGDTNPDDGIEHFDATGLTNGVKYYVSVRVVYPDQSVSKPSNELIAVCGPRGYINLAVRYQADNDGYSFLQNEYVRADAVSNDLYFFHQDGVDYLASPKRLDGFINDTRFLVLPYRGSIDEVATRLRESNLKATDDQVEISQGNWVLLECTGGTKALVRVEALTGAGRDRKVKLFFAYSALVGEVFF